MPHHGSEVVAGFMYRSDWDTGRDETVCEVVGRGVIVDNGFGIEPVFVVRFDDGFEREVLAQSLSPWYPI